MRPQRGVDISLSEQLEQVSGGLGDGAASKSVCCAGIKP